MSGSLTDCASCVAMVATAVGRTAGTAPESAACGDSEVTDARVTSSTSESPSAAGGLADSFETGLNSVAAGTVQASSALSLVAGNTAACDKLSLSTSLLTRGEPDWVGELGVC